MRAEPWRAVSTLASRLTTQRARLRFCTLDECANDLRRGCMPGYNLQLFADFAAVLGRVFRRMRAH